MHLQFQYSIDDFREAQAISLASSAGMSRPRRMIISVWYYFSAILYGVLLATYEIHAPKHLEPLPTALIAVFPILLWAMILAFQLTVQYWRLNAKTSKPWDVPIGRTLRAVSTWRRRARALLIIAMLLLFLLLTEWYSRDYMRTDLTPLLRGCFAALAAWSVFSLWAVLVNRIAGRASGQWESQQFLHGPMTIWLDAQGVRISATHFQAVYRWAAIQGFVETGNLFLLYPSTLLMIIIPKRALMHPAELDALCALLRASVAHGQLLPRRTGFEVLPAPAIPVGSEDEKEVDLGL